MIHQISSLTANDIKKALKDADGFEKVRPHDHGVDIFFVFGVLKETDDLANVGVGGYITIESRENGAPVRMGIEVRYPTPVYEGESAEEFLQLDPEKKKVAVRGLQQTFWTLCEAAGISPENAHRTYKAVQKNEASLIEIAC